MAPLRLATPPTATAAGRASLGHCRPKPAAPGSKPCALRPQQNYSTYAASCSRQPAAAFTGERRAAMPRLALASRAATRQPGMQRPQAASQPLWTPAAAIGRSNGGGGGSGVGIDNSSGSSSQRAGQPEVRSAPGRLWRLPPAIMPWHQSYLKWNAVATFSAAITAFLVPWEVAFVPAEQLYNLSGPWALLNLALVAVFGVDMLLSSRLAFFEGEVLVDSEPQMAQHYFRGDFAADLLGFLPADWLALGALAACSTLSGGAPCIGSTASWAGGALEWLPLLRLLHLARLYRLRQLFSYLEYNLNVSLLQVTIARNLAIVLLATHLTACGFFLAGWHSGFSSEAMHGADSVFLAGLPPSDQYLYSLYWAVTTLSMVEANSVPASMPEIISATVRASLFMLFNTALGSYIVGTITLLVVKADERTGHFRERSAHLNQYTQTNRIPPELRESMQEHLRLHFDTQDASDEQVLSIFPTTIRRRILQYLYMRHLRTCYLFRSCPQRFLDALLASARVEVFMPGVDILSSGDTVSELFLLLSGAVEVVSPDPGATSQPSAHVAPQGDSLAQAAPDYQSDLDAAPALGGAVGTSGSGAAAAAAGEPSLNPHSPISADLSGQRRPVGEGSVLGEAAFFTEVPQLEAVRSLTVCRVLVVGRATYASLERAFPHSARLVLHNLKRKAENAVAKEFRGRLKADELDELWAAFSRLQFGWASTELQDDVASMSLPSLDHHDLGDIACWSPRQQQVMSNLLRIRAVAQQHISRQEVERTTEFLWAASQGNEAKVRQMLQQGCPADSADYDARTALELACVKGHGGVVDLLLAAGANVNLQDNLGSCAMLEACKYGHADLISKLKRAGASLDGKRTVVEQAAMLCTAVFEGNLPLARRLLHAGVRVDSGDYDKRTALHISAAEGNLQAVRLLVEEGGADMQVTDRWGHTPLDEALRVGAGPVVRYLTRQLGAHEAQPALANEMPGTAAHEAQPALASAATAQPGAAAHTAQAAAGAATAAAPEAAANGVAARGAAGREAVSAKPPAPRLAKSAATTATAAVTSAAGAAACPAGQPAARRSNQRGGRAGTSGSGKASSTRDV